MVSEDHGILPWSEEVQLIDFTEVSRNTLVFCPASVRRRVRGRRPALTSRACKHPARLQRSYEAVTRIA